MDEYDDTLRRKPSPVRFERTSDGDIILPGRRFLTKVEGLADNPVVPQEVRNTARLFSRIALVEPLILSGIQTVSVTVRNRDGSELAPNERPRQIRRINTDEGRIIVRLFEQYATGTIGITNLAKQLNAEASLLPMRTAWDGHRRVCVKSYDANCIVAKSSGIKLKPL
ncbi:MAG: hypothetical protein ABW047_08490 [Nitrospiraceae bacterium]